MSYSNAMVGHLWAQREKSSARSSHGSMSFVGPVVYSYSTPIAAFVNAGKQTVALITSRRYSVTTSGKHMPAVWRALPRDLPQFTVPFVRPYGKSDHETNLAHLAENYKSHAGHALRARDYYRNEENLTTWLESAAETARAYAKFFKLKAPRFDPVKDAAAIMAKRAARDAKRNTPAAVAKRAKAAAAREALKARKAELERLEGAERLAAWKRGEPVLLRYGEGRDANGGAYLRVRGDNLETSQGASVPLAHAIRVYRFVKLCRERGEAWQRNGRSLRVGHFQVDAVQPDGSFRAGCHNIAWPEIEAAALQAGVADLAPEDTREGEAATSGRGARS